MIATTLAALVLLTQAAPDDPEALAVYEAEAAVMFNRARLEQRCVDLPRPEGETVAACTDRRMALLETPSAGVSAPLAGDARSDCETDALRQGETLGACIVRVMTTAEDVFAAVAAPSGGETRRQAAPPPPPPAPRATCRREDTRSEDGSSTSSTIICGNGNHDAVEAMLDSLTRPND